MAQPWKDTHGWLTPYKDTTVPITRPATKAERAFVARYRRFRDRCRDSPLHTVLGDTIRVRKPDGHIATEVVKVNTFEAMPTYTNKYKRKKRLVPKLDYRPYITQFFPQELWSTLGPEYASQASTPRSAAERRRIAELAKKSRLEEVEADIEEAEREREENENKEEEQGDDDDGDDEKEKNEEEGEDITREDVDDDFEDQEDGESAADDDYNAEKYFDNGEDDDFGDLGGGDDFDEGGFDD
jgi:DNA-directed RNA polymerase III subunit RPC7